MSKCLYCYHELEDGQVDFHPGCCCEILTKRHKKRGKKGKLFSCSARNAYLCSIIFDDTYEKEQISHHIDNYCHRAGVDDRLLEA